MLIEDVIGNHTTDSTPKLYTIKSVCSQFLTDSVGSPLYRSLPTSYSNFHKVKVRAKKSASSLVGQVFNKAFESDYTNITQRAVFLHPSPRFMTESTEPFYVFPINGFKFLYSKEVRDSSCDHDHVINTIFEEFTDGSATDIASDLLKLSYTGTNLIEGISADAEIVVYGIPYFYAIRTSIYPDYQRLLSRIKQQ